MNRKSNVLRIVLLVFLSLVIGFGAYSCNAKSIAGNSLPMPLGFGVATVMSGSMEPELSIDDVIIVKSCDEYKVDDIVVFQDGRSLTVHKIIAMNGDTVLTKGTANNTPDSPIKVSDIKGKVIFDVPKLGVAVNIAKSPAVTLLIIGAALLLLLRSYRKEDEQTNEDVEKIKAEIERLKAESKDKQE